MLKFKFNALKSILTDFSFVKVQVLKCTFNSVKVKFAALLLTRSGSMFTLKDMLPRSLANAPATKDAVMHTKDTQMGKENDHHEGCNPGSASPSEVHQVVVSSLALWHRRFGHLWYDNVGRLVVSEYVIGMESVSSVVKPNVCEVCVQAKAKTLPLSASQSKAEAP
jgi:hypothetical protein